MPAAAVQLDLFSCAMPVVQEQEPEPELEFRKLEQTNVKPTATATLPLITEMCPAFSIAAEHLAQAGKTEHHRFAVKTSVAAARAKMRGDVV